MTLGDLYKICVRDTEIRIFYKTMTKTISYADAKNMKVCLVVPQGDLRMNVIVEDVLV